MTDKPSIPLTRKEFTKLNPDQRPMAMDVRKLKAELYQVLRGIPTTLGGGNHGFLGLAMTPAVYAALPGAPAAFLMPNNPGQLVIPGNPNANVRTNMTKLHEHNLLTFQTASAVEATVKEMLLRAIPSNYVDELSDAIMEYADVTIEQIITHLTTAYGTIKHDDLMRNKQEFEAPWDPTTPLETLYKRASHCRQFATAGNNPISEATTVMTLLQVIEQSAALPDAVKDWRKKPSADQTWAAFKEHFTEADTERIRQLSAAEAGYQAANQSTKEPMAANKAAEDREPPTKKQKLITGEGYIPNSAKTIPITYCHTHGVTYGTKHNSITCTNKAPGHKDEASLANPMGGTKALFGKWRQRTRNN